MGGCLSKGEQNETGPKATEETTPAKTEEAAPVKTEEEAPAKTDGAAPKSEETAKSPDDGAATVTPDGEAKVDDGSEKPEETPVTDPAEETPAVTEDAPEKPVVFVLGASGQIGSATVKYLSENHAGEVEIRAGVRHPEGADQLKSLSNVTLVQASMAEKDELVTALSGVSVLYIVVPGAENRAELAALAADAAKEADVRHILVVSLLTAELEDTIFGRQFKEIEGKISGLDIPYTILRMAYFMDNVLGYGASVKENGQFFSPISADKPFTPLATSDAGKAAAAILIDPSKHAGKIYNLASDRITNDDIATALSSISEKEVSFVKAEMEDTKQGLLSFGIPEWQADGILELFKLMEEGSPTANLESIGDFKEITGQDPETLKDFLTRNAAVFQ